MNFLVIDPLRGSTTGFLYRLSSDGRHDGKYKVGYAAEVTFQPDTRELHLLESDAEVNPMTYSLRTMNADSMREGVRREIPCRPMYAGFSGRSSRCPVSSSGRFVYFLKIGPFRFDGEDMVFRITPARWDREEDKVEVGQFFVDSCFIDFGLRGNGDDDLFIHLSCECASTMAFGNFASDKCQFICMEDLPRRQHGPLETNGSWTDKTRKLHYCVNRVGTIYVVDLTVGTCRVLAQLRLPTGMGVPVHQIHGAAGQIHVGVAYEREDVGLGLVKEIWSVSAETGEFFGRRLLSHSIMSFVITSDGKQLAGVNPYARRVVCIDRETGDDIWCLNNFGEAPGEILIVE